MFFLFLHGITLQSCWLFWFMIMPFLSQRFCSAVRMLMVFPLGKFGNKWVILWGLGVLVISEFCGSKGLMGGRFVQSWRLNNFCMGEISFFIGLWISKEQSKLPVLWIIFCFFQSTSNGLDWSLSKSIGLVIVGTNCLMFKGTGLWKFLEVVTGKCRTIVSN